MDNHPPSSPVVRKGRGSPEMTGNSPKSWKLSEELTMNWDTIKGNWKQFRGDIRSRWGKLTDDQMDVIGGEREKLAGHIQESYGVSRDEAEKQIEDFEKEAKK